MSKHESMSVSQAVRYASARGLEVQRQTLYESIRVHRTIEHVVVDGHIRILTDSFNHWLEGFRLSRDLKQWRKQRREILSATQSALAVGRDTRR
jgi:hypothetical protein